MEASLRKKNVNSLMPVADKEKHDSKSEPSLLTRLLTNIFLGANLFALVLLWTSCATTWLNPSLFPRMTILGLAFPLFLLPNLLFIPLWLLLRPRMVLVPLLGIGLCGSYIFDYVPLRLSSSSQPEGMKVLSWNAYAPSDLQADTVSQYLLQSEADIICLQEFAPTRKSYQPLLTEMTARGYQQESDGNGRYVFSRYPILDMHVLDMATAHTNGVMALQLLVDADTVCLLNCHFESISFSDDDKGDLNSTIHDPDRSKVHSELRFLARKLASPAAFRGRQVECVGHYLDSLPSQRSVLLCGDFNDTPISYTYQHISRRLQSSFRQAGRGVGVTYAERNFPIRIDHIFSSSHWQCTRAEVQQQVLLSDHYPVVAYLKKSTQ